MSNIIQFTVGALLVVLLLYIGARVISAAIFRSKMDCELLRNAKNGTQQKLP